MVRFGVLIVLRRVPFFGKNTWLETLGAFLEGGLNRLAVFTLDALLLLMLLFSPSNGRCLNLFR
jgi:hypothetical protein